MRKTKIVAVVVLALLALGAFRVLGLRDVVAFNSAIVVTNTETGCTMNHYPGIVGQPWVVQDGDGQTVYQGSETNALRWVLHRCE